MIKEMKPLSMAETKNILKGLEETEKKKQIESFIKKFSKISFKESAELKENLEKLALLKLKPEHIAKIIDLLPTDAEDLNKIFTDVSLDEDETSKVLEIVKKYL